MTYGCNPEFFHQQTLKQWAAKIKTAASLSFLCITVETASPGVCEVSRPALPQISSACSVCVWILTACSSVTLRQCGRTISISYIDTLPFTSWGSNWRIDSDVIRTRPVCCDEGVECVLSSLPLAGFCHMVHQRITNLCLQSVHTVPSSFVWLLINGTHIKEKPVTTHSLLLRHS